MDPRVTGRVGGHDSGEAPRAAPVVGDLKQDQDPRIDPPDRVDDPLEAGEVGPGGAELVLPAAAFSGDAAGFHEDQPGCPLGELPVALQGELRRVALDVRVVALRRVVHQAVGCQPGVDPDRLAQMLGHGSPPSCIVLRRPRPRSS